MYNITALCLSRQKPILLTVKHLNSNNILGIKFVRIIHKVLTTFQILSNTGISNLYLC